jgi:uncharacterized membrane protein YphA (DoxX/SURF4 family)
MLNPFPDLLVYSLVAPFIIRVVLGLIFIDLGILVFKGEKTRWKTSFTTLRIPRPEIAVKALGVIQVLGGAMILIGLYTQIAALILALLTFAEAYFEYRDPTILKRSLVFYVLIFASLLSLLFSGAGAFAFDIPL